LNVTPLAFVVLVSGFSLLAAAGLFADALKAAHAQEMPRLAAHNEAEEEEEKEEDSEGPLAWGGLIQGDAGLFDEDKTPVEIRRARLSASGTLGEVWAYESELEVV
jgi:hypothetical protein